MDPIIPNSPMRGRIYLEYYSPLQRYHTNLRYRDLRCSRALVWDISPVVEKVEDKKYCSVCAQPVLRDEALCLVCANPIVDSNLRSIFFQKIPNVYVCETPPSPSTKYDSSCSLTDVVVTVQEYKLLHEGEYTQGIIIGEFQGIFVEKIIEPSPPVPTLRTLFSVPSISRPGCGGRPLLGVLGVVALALMASMWSVVSLFAPFLFLLLVLFLLRWLRTSYFPYERSTITKVLGGLAIFPLLVFALLLLWQPCTYIGYLFWILVFSGILSIFTYSVIPLLLLSVVGCGLIYQTRHVECEADLGYSDMGAEENAVDTDQDTIPDFLDKCPTEKEDFDGVEDDDGCPDTDNDKDGVPDLIDDCPNLPGSGLDGCPNNLDLQNSDSDGDGISDLLDKCPNEKETINHFNDFDGCPDTLPPDLQELAGGLYIQFDRNSSNIKQDVTYNTELIAKLIAALKKYDGLRIKIDGHTDDSGTEDFNNTLSQNRADATKDALCAVVDCARIQTQGYGARQPIVPNDSEDNKSKNRRVDISWFGDIEDKKEDTSTQSKDHKPMENTKEQNPKEETVGGENDVPTE